MTTTTPEMVGPTGAAAVRQERLADAVRKLRTRAGGNDTAKSLLIVGGILVPLGFVLIVLGWSGAAGTTDVFEQIPYAISGGLLGLALVFAGAFCYFASWQTHMVYAARREADETKALRETMERIEVLLTSAVHGDMVHGDTDPNPVL